MANATKCLVEHGARIDRARIDAIAKSYISDEPSLTQDQALIKAAEYIQADYKRLEQGVIAEIQKQWQEQKHFYGGQDNGLQKETETTKTLTETPHVHTLQPENIPSGTANENSGHGEDRGRNSEPLVSGLAENNARTDSNGGISGRTDQSVRAGDGSIGEGKTNDTLDTSGDQPSIRSGAESTDGHTITDSDELGSGGLGKKYKDNIAAINVLKLIESENRIATPEERKVLARYVGWGALASVFDPKNKNYQAVKDLLTPEEYRSALSSTRNAFYTSKPIVDFMYKALEHLGFKGGRILEPSLGSGNFFGLMPAKLKNNSKLHGVEMDNLTSRLAKALYPNAVISTSTKFEDYQVPSGYFDVSIGNPPFGQETLADRERSPYSGFNIHNYFIAKMIDKVRDGGIVPVIVSHSFMDTINPKAREWIAQRANLIGAVRLPDTAFKENAGTEVVTDILFFQKTATPDQSPDWVKSSDLMIGDNRFSVNDYFQNNKSNVLGKETSSGSMYRGDSYNVESNGDLNKQLAGFIKTLPESIYQDGVTSELVLNDVDNTIPDGVKEGSFFVAKDGTIKQRTSDQAGEKTSKRYVPKNEGEKSRLLGQIQLRELLRSQLRLERDPLATEKQINHNRENLNKAYQEFFNKNGFINSTVNRQAFRDDTESALVQALEFDYDPGISKAVALKNNLEAKAPTAIKADILNRRVLFPPQANMTVTSARDALLSSLDNKGFIDMNHMREVYDKSEDDIIKELGDVVYDDPNAGLVIADEYLSGDVKTKLVEAESAAQGDLKYTRNIDALKKVIPKDKMPSEIFTPLSSIWVPSSVYQDFFRHISDGSRTTIAYNPATGTWLSSFHEGGTQARLRNEYGTSRLSAFELFTSLLNGKAVTVRDPIGDGKYVVNEKAIQEAKSKADKIKTTWENWLWKDEARAKQLSTLFNDRYNRTVTRKYDGSHLTLPGITPLIPLRKNQINGVWRAIQDRNILLDHVVGAGKAQSLDSKILSPTGWIRMGDIKIGDSIITQSGKSTKVDAIYPQGDKEIFKVTFSDGSSTECCDEHLWLTWDYRQRTFAQRSAKLGKYWNCAQGTVKPLSEIRETILSDHLGAKNHSIPLVNPVNFDSQITPIDAYTLGCLLGDGHLSNGCVSFTNPDEEIINYFVIPDHIRIDKVNDTDRCLSWKFHDDRQGINEMIDRLKLLGIYGHLANSKFVPDCYKFNSIDVRISLLRGLMDTDGWIEKQGKCVNYGSVSKRLIDDVIFLVQSLGGTASLTTKKPIYTYKGEKKSGQLFYNISIKMPADINPFKVSSKALSVIPKTKYQPVRYIVSVDLVGIKKAQCIRVSDPSHLYVTDDFIVTHNTFTIIASIMEMRRLGIARKPIITVPNHIVNQWKSDFSRLYPGSNVLAAEPKDFEKDGRERFFSKIATGDFDAIVIGHSSLTKIGLDPEIEIRMSQAQVDEIADAIQELKSNRGDRNIIKDMERIKINLETKLKKLVAKAGTRSKVISFNELGIDALVVDELHIFKSLMFTSQKDRVSGLGNPAGSARAMDLFFKIQWMQETLGEKAPLLTATGTPVSNSLSEMYNMQRLMRYFQLKRDGTHLFDSWSSLYGENEFVYEVAPSGTGYRISQRFSKYKNLPSLMANYLSFADVVTLDDLKSFSTQEGKVFPVPEMEGGKPDNVVADRSELQRDFFGVPQIVKDEQGNIQYEFQNVDDYEVKESESAPGKFQVIDKTSQHAVAIFDSKEDAELDIATKALTPKVSIDPNSIVGQFNDIAAITRATNGKVNALSLTGLANLAGLDYRLIDPTAPDFEGSKINKAVDNVMRVYHQWKKDKGTQLIFCDLSTPISERDRASKVYKRVYIVGQDGKLTHKSGTLNVISGYEGVPFFFVKNGKTTDVYHAPSGQLIKSGLSVGDAMGFIDATAKNEKTRNALYDHEPLTQEQIDDYRDANELETLPDGSNEITIADLEAASSSSKFSVYDDIRKKLLKRGIPEQEIAFIHDFNTPKEKEDLFKKVRSGAIRILMGSTQKMGAGTNVQERLVGLHHIDAPWRPSDLEQREGRIIRQGNSLYERDPTGFKVYIGRYATSQTYDTRRWQLLEHKALGIEQLRKYSGENEIDEMEGEASNAADMKAAASGNPLILEETKISNEIKRLTLLRRSYDDSLYSIARQKEAYKRDTGHYKRRADQFIKDQQELDKHPIPKDKKKIGDLVVSGKMITDKKEAIEAISRVISARKPTATILFRGIHFSLDFNGRNTIFSTGTADLAIWGKDDPVSDSGLLTRIENYVDSTPGRIEYYQEQAAKSAQELLKLEEMKDEGFPQQQLLQDTVVQHREIQRQLMSSTSLDAVPPEDRKEFLAEIEQRKQQLHNLGINPDKAIKYSKRSNTGLVTELAKHDEVFRHPVSKSKSLVNIMSEIAPEFKEEYHDQRGAVKATVFKAPSGREFYVFELFDIWADLSGLKEGDNGNAVYSAIGNYAFNNGKVFIVDPNGISDTAIIRRTNAMLSLALRYGSTDFLGSSKEQESGDLYKGVTPLKWEGNYFDKVNSLIHTVTSTIINNIPDLEYYRYNFDTDQFTDADGKQLADDWAKNLAGTDSARKVHAGEGTLRKVVILKSIASATSSQRPGILERLNSGRGLERGLKGIFSKAENTGSSTTAQVNKEIPSKLKSIVRVIQGYADSSVQGFFDGHLITLVADNISPDTIKSVIAHELFHWVAKTDEKVKAVLERFKSSMQARFELAKAGNATALENKAYQSVVSAETSEADSLEEFNAYLVEHYVQTTGTLKQLFDNLAASVRAFLVRHGFDMGFIKTLTPADLVALTRYSDLTASESPISEPLYSKRTDYTPEAERVKNEMKADRTAIQLTTGQKLNQVTNLWATKANQRVFDRYRSFRDILKDPTAWMMSRLSGNTGGTVEATIQSGQPFLDSSGAVDIDTSKKSLKDAAEPLQGEIDDALLYMAALRAEKENKKSDIAKLRADYLKREIRDIGKEIKDMIYNDKTGSETITKEGAKRVYDLQELLKSLNIERKQAIKRSLIRERYVTPDKIKALKTLSRGNMPDGKVRADVYEQFRKDYEEINQSIVQIAVDTGTINKDEAERWSIEGFYIPFYRFMGEESSSGPVTLDSLANNTAYKQYKGSAIPLNDLLVNIVGNWHHLVDSALKNQAATRAVSVAESMGIMKKSKGDSNGDLFIRDNGKKVHYELENPKSDEGKLVLESLLSMNYSGLKNVFMVGATNASQLLRYGVVINPAFKARNLIRDTIQALATTNVGYNPIKNVYEGWKYTKPGGLTQARMISSAGAFGDSGFVFISETEETAQGIKRQLGMEESSYLGTAKKLLDVYQDFGARLENVNRAVAFEKTLKETRNLLKSAHEANDLLAFQMHGSSTAIYEITRTVPFLNAGLQGIDKIFRSASDEKSAKRFWAVTSTYVVASVILALAMFGDDDYDKTEDWEKETYHFFKLPGSDTLYKIPRPFEMGALASIAETIARQLVSESPDPKQASIRIAHVLSEQLRLNPIPQISRPVLELWANKSMFTGRAIESEGLLHKSKPDRAYASTSLVAKGISQGLNAFGQDWPTSLSPVEVEHLVTSYTGWLGAFVLSGTDAILRPLLGQTAPSRASNVPFFGKAAEDIKRAFVEDDAPRNTKFTSQFYENLKTLEGLASDMRHAREVGDSERIKEIGNKSKNVTYYRRTSKAMTLLNKQIESIWRSDLSAEEKKARIDRLNIKRNAIAEKTVKAVKVEN